MSLSREFLKNCVVSLPLVFSTVPSVAAEKIPESLSLQLGGRTSIPIGHVEFCKTHARECNVRSDDTTPLHLTKKIWNDIVAVNAAVNQSIRPITDFELYGTDEVWTYPTDAGDCEDYALQKRKMLLRQGIEPSSLLLTVVRKRDGEGHAVLTVRTDRGDFFLDNLVPAPYPVIESTYRILKTQDPAHSGQWVSVGKKFMTAPAAVAGTSGLKLPGNGLY